MKSAIATRMASNIVSWVIALALFAVPASAADLRETGKKIQAQYGESIVTVKVVMAQVMQGNEQELKAEATGTLIGEDGLTIVPLSAIDPSNLLKRLIGPELGMLINMESRVKDIKLSVGGGKEIPATVVLRDNDLNIAFLRPLNPPDEPFKALSLEGGVAPEMLEPVVALARLGKVGNRAICLRTGEIQAIVKKPRLLYVPNAGLAGAGFGVPVFNSDGGLIGLLVIRTSLGGIDDLMSGLVGMDLSNMGLLPVVLPAEDIREIAAQAPKTAPKPEPEPEATDETTTTAAP